MVRYANTADAQRMAEIHTYGWRFAYRDLVDEAYLYGELTVAKSMERWQSRLKDSALTQVPFEPESAPPTANLVYDDGLIRSIGGYGPCRDENFSDWAEVYFIYTEPCFIGRGYGAQFMAAMLRAAELQNKPGVIVWALKDNLDAIRFYERQGFVRDGAQKAIDSIGPGKTALAEVRLSRQPNGGVWV